MLDTTRREFSALIGGGCLLLAVKVKRARGQQPAVPVVGFLRSTSPEGVSRRNHRRSIGRLDDSLMRA